MCSTTRIGARSVAKISRPARMMNRPPQNVRVRRQRLKEALRRVLNREGPRRPSRFTGSVVRSIISTARAGEAHVQVRQRERGRGGRVVLLAKVVDGDRVGLLA